MKKQKNKDVTFVTKELKNKNYINDDTKNIITFVVILIIVGAVFGVLFLLQTKVEEKTTETTTTTAVTYDESMIIIPDMFRKTDKEYMVLIYDKSNDVENTYYATKVATYESKTVKLYTANLADGMNAKYYNKDGKANTNPTKADDVVITKSTLITFKDGKVTSYITDKDAILKKLS